MERNELSLDISPSNNLKVMRIFDTSEYCQAVENYIVEVLPVNKKIWVTFYVKPGFSLTVNSSSLLYKRVNNEKNLLDLPDGVYEIKQSYKPNIHTLAHYFHLRTTAIRLKYVELLCKHFDKECQKSEGIFNEEALQLIKVKQYIDAAEYLVSDKQDKEGGISFYNEATEILKQLEDGCGCR